MIQQILTFKKNNIKKVFLTKNDAKIKFGKRNRTLLHEQTQGSFIQLIQCRVKVFFFFFYKIGKKHKPCTTTNKQLVEILSDSMRNKEH